MPAMLPGQALDGLLLAFSPSGESLAIASADGRVRTYDAGNGRLQVSMGGPSKPSKASPADARSGADKFTSLAWIGSKKGKSFLWTGVVLGTEAGDVLHYSTQLGELKWRCPGAIEGGVSSLVYSATDGGSILAAGASGELVTVAIKDGSVSNRVRVGKHAVTCLAVSADSQHALCGGSSLSVWDLESSTSQAKLTGHPTPSSVAAFSPSGEFAVSASSSEKEVCVWSTAGGAKKSKKAQPAVATLSMEDPAVQLDTFATPDRTSDGASVSGAAAFHLVAVSESGEAYVWVCTPLEDGDVGTQLLARVRCGKGPIKGAQAGKDESVLAAKLQPGPEGPVLLVARGNGAKPEFEKVALPASPPDSDEGALISLGASPEGVLLGASKENGSKNKIDAPALANGKKRGGENLEASSEEEEEKEVEDLDEADLPLEERLAAMNERVGDADSSGNHESQPAGSSTVDSLAVLLTQALRSNDRALMERCMCTGSQKIISNTVSRLQPMDAALFLKATVDRVLSKPSRSYQLAPWIKAILHSHTGYLMTAPGIQVPLMMLYQAMEGRVGQHQNLLKVHGRLNLITAHSAAQTRSLPAATPEDGEESDDGAVGAGGKFQPEVYFDDAVDALDADEPLSSHDGDVDGDNDSDDDDDDSDDDEDEEGDDDDSMMEEDFSGSED